MKRRTLASGLTRNKGRARALATMLICLGMGGGLSLPAWALSANDVTLYRQAFQAADKGRLDEAARLARRANDDLPAKVIRWMQLTDPATDAGWAELTRFIEDHPDWPNQLALRRNAESRMPPGMSHAEVRAWFERYAPLTLPGFDRYIIALMETGQSDRAIDLVRRRYVQSGFGAVEERDFRSRYVSLLRPADHAERLDRLLWDGKYDEAARVTPLVDRGRQAVAEARIALAQMSPGVDGALRRVPPALMNDPGLTYERTRWRRRKDMDAGAMELLDAPAGEQARAGDWWVERHIIARRLIEQGQFAKAYALVSKHRATEGLAFAQAEFLAGWLALRKLDRPEQALHHFEALFRGTSSPISKSRGAYWAGRAVEAMGNKELTHTWYEAAMSYAGTFYGLLAADHLGHPAGHAMPVERPLDKALKKGFEQLETVRVVRALARIEGADSDRAALFLRKMTADAKTAENYRMIGELAQEIGRTDLGVTNSRAALQDGFVLVETGYPLIGQRLGGAPDPALVHAIIRQESNFNRQAVSSAGARGLMQVMPATAGAVAKKEGLRHTDAKLTADPQHNVRIGAAYLQELLQRYGGSYILAIAAYNAGPGRVSSWLNTYGDPRSSTVDVVDWLETMPIYETRNYVQRVLENLHLYRQRLGQAPVPMSRDITRGS